MWGTKKLKRMAEKISSHELVSEVGKNFSTTLQDAVKASFEAYVKACPRLFDCQSLVTERTRLCDVKTFHEIIDSSCVAVACAEIADAHEQMEKEMKQGNITADRREELIDRFEKLKAEKKKCLPTFVFGGHSPSGVRKADCMESSGLAMMDIDHIACAPIDIYNDKIKGREKELGIALVHLTPSTEGLHLVYELKGGETRAEANQRIFLSLGLDGDPRLPEGYDEAVKDMPRCSFAVPRPYFFHIDEDLLFNRADTPQESQAAAKTAAQPSTKAAAKPSNQADSQSVSHPSATAQPQSATPQKQGASSQPASIQDDMSLEQSLKMFDMVCTRVCGSDVAGIDTMGHRHNNLLGVLSKGICKVVPRELMRQVLERRMPSYAQESECQALVDDYYGKYLEPNKPLSNLMTQIRKECLNLSSSSASTATDGMEDADAIDSWESQRLDLARKIRKHLPRGLSDTVAGLPDEKVFPVLCAVLPCAAAYAGRVRAVYRDGTTHLLGLMSAIIGCSASGKSICARRLGPWMKKMDEISAKADKEESEYKEKCRTRKANEKAPKDPCVFKQRIPFSTSLAQLLYRQQNAQGHTLFSFCEELATVCNTNNRGQWSNKRPAYTLAFDGGSLGQDYHGLDSVSTTVEMQYNWAATGTRGAFDKFFDGDSVDGGLASRVLFAEMPYRLFVPLEKEQQLSAVNKKRIAEAVEKLSNAQGTLKLKKVNAALAEWERKRIIIDMASSMPEAGDYFRRRASSIGFRCGVVAYLLTGKETNSVMEFTKLMTEYIFKEQMRLLADKYNDTTVKANDRQQRRTQNGMIFDNLPTRFTRDDLKKLKPGADNHCLSQMVSVWNKSQWITNVGKNTWEKRVNVASLLASRGCQTVTKSLSR